MKKIIWAIYCLLIVMQGAGAASTNITVKVVDETGLPLQDVKTTIVFDAQDERKKIEGLTDTNGLFSAQGEIPAKIGIGGEKDGYYRSVDNFYFIPGKDIEGLEPWGGFSLTLRAIIDPKEGKRPGLMVAFQKWTKRWDLTLLSVTGLFPMEKALPLILFSLVPTIPQTRWLSMY